MRKLELIDAVAESTEISKSIVSKVINTTLTTIIDTLSGDESVNIARFGNFEPNHRNNRKCRNPKTGDIIDVPAKVVPRFKPSKNFKDSLQDL